MFMSQAQAPEQETDESTESFANRPTASIRVGSVTASIWRNQTEKGPFYSVTYKRSYKDAEGKWHDTDSFTGVDDNLELHKAADMSVTRIVELQQQSRAR